MRKVPFAVGQFYHIYNRGVDKRSIFSTVEDLARFFQSMGVFNIVEPIESIYLYNRRNRGLRFRRPTSPDKELVNIICYCINPNHFHFLLEEKVEGGISEFMKRLGGGYTKYFNEKHNRSGALFQGRFKAVHVNSNEYLLYLSAYVNLNSRVHKINRSNLKFVKSSRNEYVKNDEENFCAKDIILDQFSSKQEYKKFAEETLRSIWQHRKNEKNIEELLIE